MIAPTTAPVVTLLGVIVSHHFPESLLPDIVKAVVAPASTQLGFNDRDGAPHTVPPAGFTANNVSAVPHTEVIIILCDFDKDLIKLFLLPSRIII